MKMVLRRGEPWIGELTLPAKEGKFKHEIIRSRFKRWYESFKRNGSLEQLS
jgi:hypothetical protein